MANDDANRIADSIPDLQHELIARIPPGLILCFFLAYVLFPSGFFDKIEGTAAICYGIGFLIASHILGVLLTSVGNFTSRVCFLKTAWNLETSEYSFNGTEIEQYSRAFPAFRDAKKLMRWDIREWMEAATVWFKLAEYDGRKWATRVLVKDHADASACGALLIVTGVIWLITLAKEATHGGHEHLWWWLSLSGAACAMFAVWAYRKHSKKIAPESKRIAREKEHQNGSNSGGGPHRWWKSMRGASWWWLTAATIILATFLHAMAAGMALADSNPGDGLQHSHVCAMAGMVFSACLAAVTYRLRRMIRRVFALLRVLGIATKSEPRQNGGIVNSDDMDKVRMALNALEKLRQSEDKLSERQIAHLDRVRECLRSRNFDDAKLGLVKMLEESQKPEELWLALAQVLLALGEDDISRLADFVTGSKSNQEDKDG